MAGYILEGVVVAKNAAHLADMTSGALTGRSGPVVAIIEYHTTAAGELGGLFRLALSSAAASNDVIVPSDASASAYRWLRI